MNSDHDTHRWVGCPIRISTDQSLLAAPHGFSQRATSFIASWCQGIHRMPLSRSKHHARTGATHTRHKAEAGVLSSLAVQAHSLYSRRSWSQRYRHRVRHPGHSHEHKRANLFTLTKNIHRTPRHTPPQSQVTHDTPSNLQASPQQAHIPTAPTPTPIPTDGGGRNRTDDPLLAKQVLYQLSYAPKRMGPKLVGQGGLEPPTPRLSSVCSNQLSY